MNQLSRNTCLALICVVCGVVSLYSLRNVKYQTLKDNSAVTQIRQSLDGIRKVILSEQEQSSDAGGLPAKHHRRSEDPRFSVNLPVNHSYADNFDHYSQIEIERLTDRIQKKKENCLINTFPEGVGLRMLWRPGEYLDDHRSVHDPQDHARIIKLIKGCSLPMDDAFLRARPQPQLYDFEKRYLSQHPLWVPEESSSPSNSRAYILNDTDSLSVGDTMAVRVDVFNSKKEVMSLGGDEIRVWFISNNARFAADVTDLNNGSYLATTPLRAEGKFVVKAALAHSSHFLGAVVRLHLLFKSLLWNVGLFKYVNGTESESTLCSHQPHLPLYKPEEICNLTHINGFPWYCGRPTTTTLGCEQYLGTKNIQHIEGWRLPVSDAQLKELERTNQKPQIRFIEVDGGEDFIVKPKKLPELKKLPLCNKVSGKKTWTNKSAGYFVDYFQWIPYTCRAPDAKTIAPENCLKDMPIYMFADSNGRQMHWFICDVLMNATEVYGTHHISGWHRPIKCVNKKLNFFSLWRAHSSPWCHSQDKWAIVMNPGDLESERVNDPMFTNDPRGIINQLNPSPAWIDELPSSGRMLVILHHYFHFTMHHFSGYHQMVLLMRDAVRRLVERNPEALVVVRGPHAAYEGWPGAHYVGGDMMGRFFEEILIKEFRDISDRVIYLRTWDATVAVENYDVHPHFMVQGAFIKTILKYVCGRRV